MLSPTFRLFISNLIVLFLLGACAPASAQPSGPSAEEIKAQISTSVALTVSAHKTEQAALASPTLLSTETSLPTPTASLFPTLTPFPTTTPRPIGGGGAPSTPAPYACSVINKLPADNTVFKPNKDFDVKFRLMNVGTKKWEQGADLLFDSGANMLTANTRYELPQVNPGKMVGPFVFDAKTPKKTGTYTMTFKVQGGLCYPYIKIIVKK